MVRIAVIGAGRLGVKIAGDLCNNGHRVKLFDSDVSTLNAAYERIQEEREMLKQDGLIKGNLSSMQILCLSRLEETVRDVDFIFEAVVEEINVKRDVFERISHLCKSDAILATNTLRLNVTDVFDNAQYKERTLGLRFLFPVYCIPEVEIMPNKYTSALAIEKVRNLLEGIGKTLYFRSGGHPLILTEVQREERKRAFREQMQSSDENGHGSTAAVGMTGSQVLPTLSSGHGGVFVSSSEQDTDCAICMDRPRDSVLCPCHHMITCSQCSKMLLNRRDACPICRKDITEIIKVYDS